MTSGERMVWAAEFVRARAADRACSDAVTDAWAAIVALRCGPSPLHDEARAMLADMLSAGGDR